MAERSRTDWAERAKAWAATSDAGRSLDDTFNQMIIAEAAIAPSEMVLDIASGTGNPAVSIALAMEGRGSVTCTDLTPRMVEAARMRARNLGLPVMRFVSADMAALPFASDTFDCVTCRFGLMYPGDKVAAAREARRALKPGGRAAYLVWGAYGENPSFYVPQRAVAAFFGEDEGPAADRHAMSAPGTLDEILDGAGFERTEERELRYLRCVEDPRNYVASKLKRSFTAKIEGLSDARFNALSQAVMDAWAPFTEDGTLLVPNTARLGIGWKPA
ncbi:MAG: class I SAM-dependent methyltransferase [Alphaproteobacteria bacterium]|nr:class I SAM-dependent methyltransferase [Alphaproteobacteria bacterium]MCZ6742696.1 class I SAM-dependent methyltransferase [Alphaproteobacteria bacterium]MCZ6849207.1 class I SAM-dependent methyltransferase [Alphaproteobacteria bacterium]